MTTKKIMSYLLLLLLLFVSCNKEDTDCTISSLDIFSTVWVAKFTQVNGQVVEAPNEIQLIFPDEESFALDLEINRCGGSIMYNHEDCMVTIQEVFCTEACCDSQFSEDLVQFLLTINKYGVTGTTLTFSLGEDLASFGPKS